MEPKHDFDPNLYRQVRRGGSPTIYLEPIVVINVDVRRELDRLRKAAKRRSPNKRCPVRDYGGAGKQ